MTETLLLSVLPWGCGDCVKGGWGGRGGGSAVLLQLISIKMTDYAVTSGRGLDLTDSIVHFGTGRCKAYCKDHC